MWDVHRDAAQSSPETPQRSSQRTNRLDQLWRQERQWFAWLTILHERLTKDGQGPLSEDGRRVLEIAKKRWLDAKTALDGGRGDQGQAAASSAPIDPQSAPDPASCTGRVDS